MRLNLFFLFMTMEHFYLERLRHVNRVKIMILVLQLTDDGFDELIGAQAQYGTLRELDIKVPTSFGFLKCWIHACTQLVSVFRIRISYFGLNPTALQK